MGFGPSRLWELDSASGSEKLTQSFGFDHDCDEANKCVQKQANMDVVILNAFQKCSGKQVGLSSHGLQEITIKQQKQIMKP